MAPEIGWNEYWITPTAVTFLKNDLFQVGKIFNDLLKLNQKILTEDNYGSQYNNQLDPITRELRQGLSVDNPDNRLDVDGQLKLVDELIRYI